MRIKIRCLSCGELYVCNQGNTKIVGPVITTECPICGVSIDKNYSAFLDVQYSVKEGRYTKHNEKACTMIAMAHSISKVISNEESFKKKKK